MAIFRENGPYEVSIDGWNGHQEEEFLAITKMILSPLIDQDIIISVPHKNVREPLNDKKFHIWLWSAPKNSEFVRPPAYINEIKVACRDNAFTSTGLGVTIYDKAYAVAELLPDDLYIFHDICHEGYSSETQVYTWILEQVVGLLMKRGHKRREDLIKKKKITNQEDPNKQAPSGLTKVLLLKDIDSAINPIFIEEVANLANLKVRYEKQKRVADLTSEVHSQFRRQKSDHPKIIEQEISIIFQQAKRLKVSSLELHELGNNTGKRHYHNNLIELAAKENLFPDIDDNLFLLGKIYSCSETETKAIESFKIAILHTLENSVKYNLVDYKKVYDQLGRHLSTAYTEVLHKKAKEVSKYPSFENLKIAKEILGRDFSPELETLLTKAIEKKLNGLYSRTETLTELLEAINKSQESSTLIPLDKTHLTRIADVIKRLELDTQSYAKLSNVLNREQLSDLTEVVAEKRIYTKFYDLEYITNSFRLSMSAKNKLKKLIIEAWQRRFDQIRTSAQLGNVIHVLKDEDFYTVFSQMIVSCSKRLKFKPSALCRLLKKRSIDRTLLNCVIFEFTKQADSLNWQDLRILSEKVQSSGRRSEQAMMSILERAKTNGLLSPDSDLLVLEEAEKMFSNYGVYPSSLIRARMEKSRK